jgi:hypothetical protein
LTVFYPGGFHLTCIPAGVVNPMNFSLEPMSILSHIFFTPFSFPSASSQNPCDGIDMSISLVPLVHIQAFAATSCTTSKLAANFPKCVVNDTRVHVNIGIEMLAVDVI